MITIDIITIFPKFFTNIFEYGIIKEAFAANICKVNIYNLRDFSQDKHRKVDDRPYGGGAGMVLMPEPLGRAICHIKSKKRAGQHKPTVILLTPKGKVLKQNMLKGLARMKHIVLICGRYEGVDQRILDLYVDLEISIGDYVLSGGEIPAMVVLDGLIRLLPGVVGKKESLISESFEDNLLDYPQYTRPPAYKGLKVPGVLLSGDHQKIKQWRQEKSIALTQTRRPDLFDKKS